MVKSLSEIRLTSSVYLTSFEEVRVQTHTHTHTRTLALYLMTGTHVWVSAWRHMHAHKHVHLSADRISISFLGVKWSFCAGTVGEKKKKQQVFGVQTHDREYLTSPD